MRLAVLAFALATLPAAAQTFGVTEGEGQALPDLSLEVEELQSGIEVEELDIGGISAETLQGRSGRETLSVATEQGTAALIRGLDKVSGEVTDVVLLAGESVEFGRLTVEMLECRYPANNPAGDAYALMVVLAEGLDHPAFEGWMVASSPALSALEHPRYDVWVIRCNNP